jgi:hypothetical protein
MTLIESSSIYLVGDVAFLFWLELILCYDRIDICMKSLVNNVRQLTLQCNSVPTFSVHRMYTQGTYASWSSIFCPESGHPRALGVTRVSSSVYLFTEHCMQMG